MAKLKKTTTGKEGFSSSLGVVLAAAGSAVGLGNLLFVTGRVQTYGALFFVPYTVFMILLGLPLMVGEFSVGRKKGTDLISSTDDAPTVGWFSLINIAVIAAFYFIIGGALIMTIGYSVTLLGDPDGSLKVQQYLYSVFNGGFGAGGVEINPFGLLFATFAFIGINAYVIKRGISSGIETLTKYAMPALLVILLGLSLYAIINGGEGNPLDMFAKWAFDASADGYGYGSELGVIAAAVAKAFLSLSLGCGILWTYGAFIKKSDSITKLSLLTILTDWMVVVLASVSTIVLGSWFAMPMPLVFILMILVLIAALTSSVAQYEVMARVGETYFGYSRDKVIIAIGVGLCVTTILGMLVFANGIAFVTMLDVLTESYFFIFIGLITTLYFGWRAQPWGDIADGWYKEFLKFTTKFFIPAFLAFIWLYQAGFVSTWFKI